MLSHFLFVIGHVALRQLVYIEEVERELKRLRASRQTRQQQQQQQAGDGANGADDPETRDEGSKGGAKGQRAAKGRRAAADTKAKAKASSKAAASAKPPKDVATADNDEMGVDFAGREENEAELLKEIAERELVGKSLLGIFGPIIARVCADTSGRFRDHDAELRPAAILALCKFMCISEDFCEKHLRLLVSILAHELTPASEKANIVISLGDMALRFPNLTMPWVARLYDQLKDADVRVRKNTLMVLSHLILNDMTKLKTSQFGDMVLCLEDADPRIADLARLFLQEVSRKGNNMIYNILPETITRVSTMPAVSQDQFNKIMRHLFSFIDKDKQAETLVEKICYRFAGTAQASDAPGTASTAAAAAGLCVPLCPPPRGAQDLAFCLTLLGPGERTVRRLAAPDLWRTYADWLQDPLVFAHFQAVVLKNKKLAPGKKASPEMKTLLEEFDAKLQAAHASQTEDHATVAHASAHAKKAAARKRSRPTDREDNDDDGPSSDEKENAAPNRTQGPAQAHQGAKRPATAPKATKGRGARGRQAKGAVPTRAAAGRRTANANGRKAASSSSADDSGSDSDFA
eukprot:gnl/Hemi2/12111_TR4136_c0_g1_i1.p1 gnl/Hemi2/12111_TR4136_c0_g1~~gnl/Hemi2/12111_TR4136_c0_g1_i1.p1  ORF type:complete len:598 (-),score=184.01 gnl/Hemi2/12111_TR4136_c0_g1_i1:158-1888(-)